MPKRRAPDIWPRSADWTVGVLLAVYAISIALFALRSNDIWWHLAVGREIVSTGHFIRHDPFTFTLTGTPWVPHSWLADLLFYGIYKLSSFPGLVLLRAGLVAATVVAMLFVLKRLNVSWTLAAPFVAAGLLNMHSRFLLRPHLIEYLFVVILMAHLLSSRGQGPRRFFAVPIALQLVWVNVHASFYLGIGIVALFYLGDALAGRWKGRRGTQPFHPDGPGAKRVGALLVSMAAVSFVNPSPMQFVFQPLNAEQRELLTRYTLEWRSPFDPVVSAGAFHPYFEILMVVTMVAFLVGWRRLRLASLLVVAGFIAMALQAHRFRVEFALVAVPLALDQLRLAPVVIRLGDRLTRSRRGGLVPYVLALLCTVGLVWTARDRVVIEPRVADRFPDLALDFIRDEGVARRPFHSIAHGSYLIWRLFPDRQAFIDGRGIDAALYRDFLSCQANAAGFGRIAEGYRIDGFVLPAPEASDGGMRNLHNFLVQSPAWRLAFMSRHAYVYLPAEGGGHPPSFRFYHPLTFHRLRFNEAQVDSVRQEIERAATQDRHYVRPLLDLTRFHGAMGRREEAVRALRRVLEIDPSNAEATDMARFLEADR